MYFGGEENVWFFLRNVKTPENINMLSCINITKENVCVIGTAGSGKCHHPWDDLKPCVCGTKERPLLMHDKLKER